MSLLKINDRCAIYGAHGMVVAQYLERLCGMDMNTNFTKTPRIKFAWSYRGWTMDG